MKDEKVEEIVNLITDLICYSQVESCSCCRGCKEVRGQASDTIKKIINIIEKKE